MWSFSRENHSILEASIAATHGALAMNDTVSVERVLGAMSYEFRLDSLSVLETGTHRFLGLNPSVTKEDSTFLTYHLAVEKTPILNDSSRNLRYELRRRWPVGKWTLEVSILIGVLISVYFLVGRRLASSAQELSDAVTSLRDELPGDGGIVRAKIVPDLSRRGEFEEIEQLRRTISSYQERLQADAERIKRIEVMEAKARLAAQVAHDIKSPLAALKVARFALPKDSKELGGLIRDATDRILEIVDGLDGKADLRPQRIDRQGILKMTESLLREKSLEKSALGSCPKIEWVCKLDRNFGFETWETELKRVLSNLLNNAFDAATDEEPIQLELEMESSSNSTRSPEIRFTVVNHGKPVDPRVLARLGERGLTIGKEHGSGLGLSHALEFAKRNGGTLEMKSEGRRTWVTMRIPVTEMSEETLGPSDANFTTEGAYLVEVHKRLSS
jgi:signal transduction histidine kinase